MTALELRDVSYRVGGTTLLDGVTLHVDEGEFLALIGPNGAGKSTLFHVAAGDVTPDAGSVRLFGDPLPTLTEKAQSRRRAVQQQQNSVSYAYLVREVVEMGRWPWRGTPFADDDAPAVADAVDRAGLQRFTTREVTTLSGGEQARTAFARISAQRARLVLADEPTAALDIGHQEQVLGHLRDDAASGAAVVAVLHDLNLAAAFADRVALMDGGRVVAVGRPDEVLTSQTLSDVYRTPVEAIPHPVTGQLLVLPLRTTKERITRDHCATTV